MAKLISTRSAQKVMSTEFTFTVADTIKNTAGVVAGFNASITADIINLPIGSRVVGGEVVTSTAFAPGTSYSIAVGDSAVANRYLASTDRLALGRTALVPTGFHNDSGLDVRATIVLVGTTPTAGRMTVRVQYVTDGRAEEVNSN
jgi:hypothetical protein